MLEKNALRTRLLDDFDCRENQVDGVVEKISALAPHIAAAFEEWYNTGLIKEIEVEGYNIASLRAKKKNMNIIGAYLTLDWLYREPEIAKRALEKVELVNSAVHRKVTIR
ncbi:MAG: hypothetical protein FWD13_02835 [Treponema sp.]|nr:hypothetical protein [Treponema sp.]